MKKQTCKKTFRIIGQLFLCLLVVLSVMAILSAKWYQDIYGDLGFDSILFTLTANRDGVQTGLIDSWVAAVVPQTVFLSALAIAFFGFRNKKQIVLWIKSRKIRLFPFHRWVSAALCLLFCCGLLLSAAINVGLYEYTQNIRTFSTLYEDRYKDPDTVSITFPEKKRNLIYILLESMETSFFSKEQGGLLDENVIPELYALAEENTNFSHNQNVGGFTVAPGASWTIGAMVAQTAGVPLKTPPDVDRNGYGSDGNFLPGITSLSNILHENGYQQALMVGSEGNFGGRKAYYEQHLTDTVYDIQTAKKDDLIPSDYFVWWGYEDAYLFSYAKQKILEMSRQEEPFAFTMLTVDTHHVGGYVCDYCEEVYDEQYENVYACSSRQVAAFVQWLQEQSFYEDTTIILAGDHASMDNGYFARIDAGDYERHIYNCFINAAAETENTQNRQFCTVDMLPTTLSAMGCTIEGDRLGLGTDLFSETPTLMEETNGLILDEFEKASPYYTENFFFKKP